MVVRIYLLLLFFTDKRLVNDDLCLAEFEIAGFGIETAADDLSSLSVFTSVGCGECGFS